MYMIISYYECDNLSSQLWRINNNGIKNTIYKGEKQSISISFGYYYALVGTLCLLGSILIWWLGIMPTAWETGDFAGVVQYEKEFL